METQCVCVCVLFLYGVFIIYYENILNKYINVKYINYISHNWLLLRLQMVKLNFQIQLKQIYVFNKSFWLIFAKQRWLLA